MLLIFVIHIACFVWLTHGVGIIFCTIKVNYNTNNINIKFCDMEGWIVSVEVNKWYSL